MNFHNKGQTGAFILTKVSNISNTFLLSKKVLDFILLSLMCCNSKCWQICIGVLLLLLSIVIALTEVGNVLVEFWHTNVFAGFWASLLVVQSAIAVISTRE
jgi:hypothetical protein